MRIEVAIALGALALAAGPLTACGTTCAEIRKIRSDFTERAGHTDDPHGRVTLPFGLANRLIAQRVGGAARHRVAVPVLESFGIDLGLTFELAEVRLVPAETGRVGVTAKVAVKNEGTDYVILEGRVELIPRVAPGERLVIIDVNAADFVEMVPRLTEEGRAGLGDLIRETLPASVERFLPKVAVNEVASALVTWAGAEGFELVRDIILAPLDVGTTLTVVLPDLPIQDVAFQSTRGETPALHMDFRTTLPVSDGLSGSPPVSVRPGGVEVALSMATVAEAANLAMAAGTIPDRFNSDGEPDPQGGMEARVAWGAAPNPLKIHLWQTHGECVYARVAGRLHTNLTADKLEVHVDDGVYESIRGPASVEAVAWLAVLWGETVDTQLELARRTELRVADVSVSVAIQSVRVGVDDLRLRLQVGATPDVGRMRSAPVTAPLPADGAPTIVPDRLARRRSR